MQPLDLRVAIYRLYRLRKQVAVAALLPLPAFVLALFAGLPVHIWMVPVWYLLVLAHVVRFPQAWVDLLAMALALALVLFMAPLGVLAGIGAPLGYGLAAVTGFGLWLYLCNRIHALEKFAWPQQELRLHRKTRLPAATLRDALFLRPNAQVGLNRCGPANEHGVFQIVSTGAAGMPSLNTIDGLSEDARGMDIDADLQNGLFRFWATVIRSEPDYQETMYITEPDGEEASVETTIQTLTETASGTIYQKQETATGMGLVSGFGFWLNDVDRDHFTATIDHVTGARSRAVRAAPHDTPLILLAQRLTRKRLARLHEA
ncbi:hypothetical protein [Actibacterium ureilyticum]|uniref:hypothetical protein n=1 Tax=Actibacterium ureilyticum TaxID=1590614 RepID=UPI000BAB2351|nr:hypothetical protein [Actibacterium ureilyticum]